MSTIRGPEHRTTTHAKKLEKYCLLHEHQNTDNSRQETGQVLTTAVGPEHGGEATAPLGGHHVLAVLTVVAFAVVRHAQSAHNIAHRS